MYVLSRARTLLVDFVRQLAARQHSAMGAAAVAGAANDARQAAQAAREEEEVQGRLEALLGASFPYLGMPELKQVGALGVVVPALELNIHMDVRSWVCSGAVGSGAATIGCMSRACCTLL